MATGNMKFSVVMEAVTQAFNQSVKSAQTTYTDMTSSVRKGSQDMEAATAAAAASLNKVFQAKDAAGTTSALKQVTAELNATAKGATFTTEQLKQVGTASKQSIIELGGALRTAQAELKALAATKATPVDIQTAKDKITALKLEISSAQAEYGRFQTAASTAMRRAGADTQDAADKAKSAGQTIYNALNIKTSGALRQELAQLTAQLNEFKSKAGAPAAEVERVTKAASARITELKNELKGVSPPADGAATSIKGMGSSLLGLAGVTAGLAGVAAGLKAIIDTTIQFEQVNKQLEFAVGSAAKAKEEFAFVKEVAKQMGLDVLASAGGFAKLSAATKGTSLEGQATRDIFLGVASAAATMGLSVDETNGVMLAISQIAGKGKVSMEELRGQLGERLPPAMKIAADSMGVTVQQLDKLVENGLDAQVFLKAFGPAMVQAFGPTAAKNAETLQGQINLLRNEFKELLNDLGNSGIANGAINIFKDLNNAITSIRNGLATLDPTTVDAVSSAFEQMYGVVKGTFDVLFTAIAETSATLDSMSTLIVGVVNSFAGLSGSAEEVSFLTRVLQGVSIAIGAINDGIAAIGIAFTASTGVVQSFFAAIALGISKITFGDVSARLEQLSTDLSNAAQKSFTKADEMAQKFTSKTVEAMDRAVAASTDAADKGAKAHEGAAGRVAGAQAQIGAAVQQSSGQVAAGATAAAKELERVTLQATSAATAIGGIQTAAKNVEGSIQVFKDVLGAMTIDLSKAANGAKDAFNGLAKEVGVTLPAAAQTSKNAVNDLGYSLAIAAAKNKEVADGIAREMPAAIAKLNATDLAQFKASFVKGLQDAGVSAEYLQARVVELATASAKSLGVDLVASLRGVSQAFNDNKTALLALVTDFDKLKAAGVDASKLVGEGLTAMLGKARNPVELQELIKLFQQLGSEGKISGQAMAEGIAAAKAKIDELTPGINSLAEAFKKMGLTTKEESQKLANDYRDAFAIIQASGQATAAQLEQAFTKYATAAVAANGGVVSDFLRSEAAALGLQVQVDKTGNAIVSKMGEGAAATDKFASSVDKATSALEAQNSALERQISAREKALDLAEREAALERKRKNVDKDGFTLDNNGNRLTISVITPASAFNAAKDAGLSDKSALAFKAKYDAIGNKNDPRFGDFNAFYEELNRLKVEEAAQRVREEEAKKQPGNTSNSNSNSRTTTPTTSAPNSSTASRTSAPTTTTRTSQSLGQVTSSSSSKTVNVNFALGGQSVSGKIAAEDEASFVSILQRAKGLS